MARGIGNGPTNRLSRTKAPRVRGYTPTFIARKAIRATHFTGMVERGSLFAENRSMQNGIASQEACWDKSGVVLCLQECSLQSKTLIVLSVWCLPHQNASSRLNLC